MDDRPNTPTRLGRAQALSKSQTTRVTEVNIADYIRQLSLELSRMASQIGETYLTALLKVASDEAARAVDRDDMLGKD